MNLATLVRLHLETDLDEAALQTALKATGTGELVDADNAHLDLQLPLEEVARYVAPTVQRYLSARL